MLQSNPSSENSEPKCLEIRCQSCGEILAKSPSAEATVSIIPCPYNVGGACVVKAKNCNCGNPNA